MNHINNFFSLFTGKTSAKVAIDDDESSSEDEDYGEVPLRVILEKPKINHNIPSLKKVINADGDEDNNIPSLKKVINADGDEDSDDDSDDDRDDDGDDDATPNDNMDDNDNNRSDNENDSNRSDNSCNEPKRRRRNEDVWNLQDHTKAIESLRNHHINKPQRSTNYKTVHAIAKAHKVKESDVRKYKLILLQNKNVSFVPTREIIGRPKKNVISENV